MKWQSDSLTESNRKINYYFSEDTKKPPLILLHGATDNGLCWIPTADKLAEKYFVIMPDARGHGFSETKKGEYFSFDSMAEDVAILIQKLGLNQTQLIGHSMGGATAALAAANYPDLVHKIVLEDPGILIEKVPFYIKPIAWLLLLIFGGASLRGSLEKIEKRGKKKNPTWPNEVFKPWAESKIQYKKNNKYFLLGMLNMKFYWKTFLKDIKCPILLITSSGGIISDKRAHKISDLCKDLEWIKIDGAKHNIRREQQDKYIEVLNKFLD